MSVQQSTDVWCDGGPWDGLQLVFAHDALRVAIPGKVSEGDEMVEVEHVYYRYGNIAVYDGWRRAE
jgi:hypothetical protein